MSNEHTKACAENGYHPIYLCTGDHPGNVDQFPESTAGELWEEIISGKYGDEPARDMMREIIRRNGTQFFEVGVKRCFACFVRVIGYEPDMGDDNSTFAPGTCSDCGTDGIMFEVLP